MRTLYCICTFDILTDRPRLDIIFNIALLQLIIQMLISNLITKVDLLCLINIKIMLAIDLSYACGSSENTLRSYRDLERQCLNSDYSQFLNCRVCTIVRTM